jgi:hypothetical protein
MTAEEGTIESNWDQVRTFVAYASHVADPNRTGCRQLVSEGGAWTRQVG